MWNSSEGTENSHFPCICTEIGKWERSIETKPNDYDDVEIATFLLRCQATSARAMQSRSIGRLSKSDAHASDNHYTGYVNRLLRPLSDGLNYLHYTWALWRAPSETLVTYTRFRGRGCPWQIGVLPSEVPNVSEVYVISEGLMEGIKVRNPTGPAFATGQRTVECECNTLKELENILSVNCSWSEEKSELHTSLSQHQPFRRWQLKYVDPWPSWRCISFNSDHFPEENSGSQSPMRLAAIAYSNGSVEVINLSATGEETSSPGSKTINRTQILIPAPFDIKIKNPQLSLNPVVYVTFFGDDHLLVCHFRGHVDLWHIDWSAKRFPSRLMSRFTPYSSSSDDSGRNKSSSFFAPVLAADLDLRTQTLILAGLPRNSGGLRDRLDLRVYHVSKNAPFVTSQEKLSKRNLSLSQIVRGQLSYAGMMLGHVLNKFGRISTFAQSQEAVAFVRINPTVSDDLIAGVLHTSGTCSIWSLSELEPLCVVIGTSTTSPAESNLPLDSKNETELSNPFRLTWWDSEIREKDTVQLAVLREDGTLNVLKHGDSKTSWLTLPSHQVRELGLHQFATFAHTSVADSEGLKQTRELLVVDFGADPDTVVTGMSSESEFQTGKPVVRAIQLASTTETGLFCHFIHSRRYEEAITLTKQYKLDVELVYQQQWLHLAIQTPYLADFENLISSTLGLIKCRPLWVIQQCILYLPPTANDSLVPSEQLFSAMRALLNHGLRRLRALRPTTTVPVSEQTRVLLEHRLLQQLEHIDAVQSLLPIEANLVRIKEPHSAVYDIRSLVSTLRSFRHHALIDIAIEYAHAGRFPVVQQLMKRYPKSLGRYRLAIASSLPETVRPSLYVEFLLRPEFSTASESAFSTREELEQSALNRLGEIWPEFHEPLEDDINPSAYVKRLAKWLVLRAREIDLRTGLTNFALALVESGGSLCSSISSGLFLTDSELAAELTTLRRVRWNLAFLTEIVYRKPDYTSDSTNHTRATATTHSKSQPVVLARLRLNEFERLSLEDRLDMLIQLRLGKTSKTAAAERSVVAVWTLLTSLMIHYCGSSYSKRLSELMTYCLWRMVVFQGLGSIPLVLTAQAGRSEAYGKPNGGGPDGDQQWWSNADACTSIPAVLFLTSVVRVMRKYQPVISDDRALNALLAYSQHLIKAVHSANAYVDGLQNSLLPGDQASLDEISCDLEAIQRSAIGLNELCDVWKAMQHRLVGSQVKIGITSVAQLLEASTKGSDFRQLLTRWMTFLTRLAQLEEVKPHTNPPSGITPTVPISELLELASRFRDILNRTFKGCPAEQWVTYGLQFSLLAAGNERLLAVSRQLLSSHNADVLSGPAASHWLLCLLLAVRDYVNSSVPSPSSGGAPVTQKVNMEPNERLARQCIELFRSLPDLPVKEWRSQFDREEQLLDAASFLSEVREVTGKSFPVSIVPRQLRPLWCDPNQPKMVDRRCSLFESCVHSILTMDSTGRRANQLQACIESGNLPKIGQLFDLSPVQSTSCFLNTLFRCLTQTCKDGEQKNRVADWMPGALTMLTDILNGRTSSYWSVCAQWAGYTLEEHPDTQIAPMDREYRSFLDARWTPLHALFCIKPGASSQRTGGVERFRLRLVLFAIAYCPPRHLIPMSQVLIVALYRLAQVVCASGKSPNVSLTNRLGHLIREHWSPSRHSDSEGTKLDDTLKLRLPPLYLAIDSTEKDNLSELIEGDKSLMSPRQLASWIVCLESWLGEARPDLTTLTAAGLDTAIDDTRLCQAFASMHGHLSRMTGSSACLNSFQEQLKLLSSSQPDDTVSLSSLVARPLFADQLRLFLTLCAHSPGELKSTAHSVNNCFPSNSTKLRILQTISNPLIQQWSFEAVLTSLARELKRLKSDVDLALFDSDEAYRKDTILDLCRSHLFYGLRLALFCRLPLEECFYSRLTTLFVESQVEEETERSEVRSIIHWIVQFPDGLNRFLTWMETAIYPWLVGSSSPAFLFSVIPVSSSSSSSFSVAGLSIAMHRKILSVLTSNAGCSSLFTQLSYAKLIAMLLHTDTTASGDSAPTSYPLKSFRDHLLYPYVKSDPVMAAIKNILSIVRSTCSTACTPEDLAAIHSLRVLDELPTDKTSFDFRSYLRSSLAAIAPAGASPHQSRKLEMWLQDVLFDTQSQHLSIDQRHIVLEEAVEFLNSRSECQTGSTDNEWNCLLGRIVAYRAQVGRVTELLKNVTFPTGPEDSKTSDFYARFLQVRPDQTETALNLIVDLITCVREDHSRCGDHPPLKPNVRCLDEKLLWFADHLPDCFCALGIPEEASCDLLVKAVAQLVPPSSSALQHALMQLGGHSRDTAVDLSRNYVRLVNNATRTVSSDDREAAKLRLFGRMLAEERIRRAQGLQLVQAVENQFAATKQASSNIKSFVFTGAILAASRSVEPHTPSIDSFLTSLDRCSEGDQATFVFSQLDQLLRTAPRVCSSSDDSQTISTVHKLLEFAQATIELVTLLLQSREKRPNSPEQLRSWGSWLSYGIACGVFSSKDHSQDWLLHQWTQYGSPPPHGLAWAGLSYLKTLGASDFDQATEVPIYPCSTIVSACFYQPDRELVEQAVDRLTSLRSPKIVSSIDPEACLHLICVHGSLWPSLISTGGSTSPAIFGHILRELEVYLTGMSSAEQRSVLLGHSLRLLRNAHLWLESARLARLGTPTVAAQNPLSALVGLVRELTRPA